MLVQNVQVYDKMDMRVPHLSIWLGVLSKSFYGFYQCIADGQQVDVKRMILTE